MKKLLNVLVGSALLLALAAPAFAQDAGPKQAKPGAGQAGRGNMLQQQFEELSKRLKLTADQKTKVKALNEQTMKKMQDARKAGNGDRAAMRPKMMEIRQWQQAEMKKILTPTQQAEFDKYQKEMREKMRAQGGRPGGQRPGTSPR